MNRPTMLMRTLIQDVSMFLDVQAERDLQTLEDRCKHEGYGFLAITLPSLCDALEQGIESGRLSTPHGFRAKRGGTLPLFLGGLFRRVFDEDGVLLADADPHSIWGIRQITRFFKKPFVVCDESRLPAATRQFIQVEQELDDESERTDADRILLRAVSDVLWNGIFSDLDPSDLIACHGPGATAERKTVNDRYTIRHWPERSDLYFPLDLHAIPNWNYVDELEKVEYLSSEDERPVRVVFVPKTMKTPRVIAIEPYYMQYMQQGLMRYVVPLLESHPLTSGSINFSDQSVNQKMAKRNSVTREFATLDLSEASDRVSLKLVEEIFRCSHLLPYLQGCRSSRAELPYMDQPLTLKKFASMGSAMCFPVESMVFYTLVMCAYHDHYKVRPSRSSILRFKKDAYVYGDDIIIRHNMFATVVRWLSIFGLKVNQRKSFVNSHFRESCGADYYAGIDVKPVYLRRDIRDPDCLSRPDVVMSLVSTANQLYEAGLWSTAKFIRHQVEKRWGPIPTFRIRETDSVGLLPHYHDQYRSVTYTYHSIDRDLGINSRYPWLVDGLAWTSFSFTTSLCWDRNLQSWRQRRWAFRPRYKSDLIPSEAGHLLKAFRNIGLENSCRFDSSVKRGAFTSKRRWTSALYS